ncbi:hypothetical protein CASFOL_026219 [Castilleja foliolosa]|uniref:Uncharacterized protein n=1 Tax=Castilleja foliolosa TaxID=1961234 RepID=A0ABD3CJY2_9LAMI
MEKRGNWKWAKQGAVLVLIVAIALTSKLARNQKSCPCSQDSRKYTGIVEDCCCDYETVDSLNGAVLHPLLQDLVKTPFFRYFKMMFKIAFLLLLHRIVFSVVAEVSQIYFSDRVDTWSSGVVQNPESSREKGKRLRNRLTKQKGKDSAHELLSRKPGRLLKDGIITIAGDGYIVHPSVPPTSTTSNFIVVSPSTSSNLHPLPHSLCCSYLSSK